jgi:class 3 adenylate cyclase
MGGHQRLNSDPVLQRRADAIRLSGLFSELAQGRRDHVVRNLLQRRKEYQHGEPLCSEGEQATAFWLISRGLVTVEVGDKDVDVFLVQRGPGALIGELAALRPGAVRSATVRAMGNDTEAWCVDVAALDDLAIEDKAVVWRDLAMHIAGKMADAVPARIASHRLANERETLLRHFVNEDALGLVRAGGAQVREVRRAIIWFSDLVGFSSMAASAAPGAVARSVNAAMTAQSDIIEYHEGLVDKFMGDGVMAYWLPKSTAELEMRRVAGLAVDAAAACLDAISALRSPTGETTLQVRIGLHVGDVHYGNFGSGRRWAYTLIGQPVNLAARIESAKPENSAEPFGPVRVSSDLAAFLEPHRLQRFPDLASTQVKTDRVTFIHRQPK